MSGFEQRLDDLRARGANGTVDGRGVRAPGGPLPHQGAGYWGMPVIKPPVWTWEVPLYFFTGGLGGMAAVLAAVMVFFRGLDAGIVRAAAWTACAGAMVSPVLLTLDLGRPSRFLHMLRVFKIRSPMSVGAWTLSAFGAFAVPAAPLLQWGGDVARPLGAALVVVAGLVGSVLATYTGVLIGTCVVPAWVTHRRTLPVHFGIAGLGSAVATLEIFGFFDPALHVLGFLTASVETLLWLSIEFRRHGAADAAVRSGPGGWMLRTASVLAGPSSLALRALGLRVPAAVAFAAGALLSRYGWLAVGRASAKDPEATFALQRG